MDSILNIQQENKIEKPTASLSSRSEELTNYIVRNYGYFIHSNIMATGIEAVNQAKCFFDQAAKVCETGTESSLYTEEHIVNELLDVFQKYREFLAQKQRG
jgi:uncharacterized membrane protein YcgQ (UPF0703/DUF1980 family)